MPIGGQQVNKSEGFLQHHINLQPGDALYLFSDGYADQFGGEKGKKFMIKNLRETLLTINHLPMKEQKNHLYNTFIKWKGVQDQVDDILVIGIKIS